jgi:hypothetical protein
VHPQALLITGLHRSGTTWVGKLIEASGQFPVVHEPFNPHHGLRGLTDWYSQYHKNAASAKEKGENDFIDQSIDSLLDGSARWTRDHISKFWGRRLARRLFGSGVERNYRVVFRHNPNPSLCLKDPFALFLSERIIERRNAKIVGLIRHPAALYRSMNRMSWSPNVRSLLGNPELVALLELESGVRFASGLLGDRVDALTSFWVAGALYLRHVQRKYPDNVLLLTHESLSSGEPECLEQLAGFSGIEDPKAFDSMYREYNESISGSVVAPKPGVIHEFRRDGKSLANAWKRDLDLDISRRISSLAGQVLKGFYPDD